MTQCLTELRDQHANFSAWFVDESLSPARARNYLLSKSTAEWRLFIDDDAFVEPDFFERFFQVLEQSPSAGVIGGPNLTPAGSSLIQRATGVALSSRFGAWSCSARYAPRLPLTVSCDERILISCNLFVRREAMEDLQFPLALKSNEENWVLQDLMCRRQLMVYAPQLFVWHHRRGSLEALAAQMHTYGIGRGQNLRRRPWTARFFYVVPALTVVLTAVAVAGLPWRSELVWIWIALAIAYVVLWVAASTRLRSRGEDRRARFVGAALFPVIHLAYGLGVLRGLVSSGSNG